MDCLDVQVFEALTMLSEILSDFDFNAYFLFSKTTQMDFVRVLSFKSNRSKSSVPWKFQSGEDNIEWMLRNCSLSKLPVLQNDSRKIITTILIISHNDNENKKILDF